MRRTKEKADETRQEILRAAENLFLEHGYDHVSLETIAAAAGVTRGAVHWHFTNKQGLLFALRDESQHLFRELAEELAVGDSPAPLERLGQLVSTMFLKLNRDPRQRGLVKAMMHLDMTLAGAIGHEDGSFRLDAKQTFLRIFEAPQVASTLIAPWSPDAAASALSAAIHGLISEWALGIGDFELIPYGQEFIKMVLAGWTDRTLKNPV